MKDAESLEAAVGLVFGESCAYQARAVRPGGENRSWHVTLEGRSVIAKMPERAGGLTIAPELEYELLLTAAETGIAPQPLGFDLASGIFFVEFFAGGEELDRAATIQPRTIERVARTLRTLHALDAPATLREFDPSGFAAAYCAAGNPASVRLRGELERLTAGLSRLFAGSHICHNDLHAGNILSGERLWLIDFEYAVQAAPIVDLASYVAFNELDAQAAMNLARACIGAKLPFSASELAGVVRIQQILGQLWEMARSDNNGVS